jgi:hypothetical protein
VLADGAVVVPWAVSGISRWKCHGCGELLASVTGGECATRVVFSVKAPLSLPMVVSLSLLRAPLRVTTSL